MNSLYENIKALRKKMGWSQLELARRAGYSDRTSIAKIESGLVDLQQSRIAKFAEIFGISEIELMVGNPAEEKGYRFPSEAIAVPNFSPMKKIPVLGASACGSPIEAVREWDYIEVEKATRADFALIAEGKSMTGCGIMDGSMVLFQETPQVDNGQIAAVRVDNATTIKRFYQYPDMVILRACNPDFDDQEYRGDDLATIHVFGRAVACLTGF